VDDLVLREDDIEPAEAPGGPSPGPLHGYRILDLSSVVMGPYGTQILGDLGAEVIWIEPLTGQKNRGMGPGVHPEFSGIALNLLRNKRSLCLDLKAEGGRDVLARVLATCDAVVTNLRPAPLKRLRLSYEDVREIRPDIIFCQAQGFRTDSGRGDDPAYDDIIQAESGLADAARRTGRDPAIAPTILADKICGMALAQAVTAALLHRERTGRGQRVEVPMLDVLRAFILVEHGAGAVASVDGQAGYSRVLATQRGPQRTLDGWINILPYSTSAYDALFAAGDRHDLVGDPRTKGREMQLNADFLYGELRGLIAQRTTAEWLSFCKQHQIPVGEIADLDDIVRELPMVQHPHAGAHRTIPTPVLYSDSTVGARTPAPRIGEDTAAVLREAGLSDGEIRGLEAAGVVRTRS
jgi:crotonobetainyl-CoA:carnitine CoA-transferase CaiB-like acyl-CoA transferase